MSQPQLFSQVLIELLRRYSGEEPERLDPNGYFSCNELRDVPWLPRYLYRTGERVWAIEIARDDFLSPDTLASMKQAASKATELTTVVLVPQGEPYESIARESGAHDISVAVWTETGYDFLRLGGPAAPAAAPALPTRIPPDLADKVANLAGLHQDFREVLRQFSNQHRGLRSRPRDETDREEQELLKRTLSQLIAIDRRFVGGHDPLDVLRVIEQWSLSVRTRLRDHYYHSFHNFLLGCVVLDRLRDPIGGFFREAFPSTELYIEYVWLLAALYHDVGYLVQRGPELTATRYGIDISADIGSGERREALTDYEVRERNEYWQSGRYRSHRRQLVSLYEHLTQERIEGDWTAEGLLVYEVPAHPLDRALERNFMSADGHGAASCLRMLMEIEGRLTGVDMPLETRQFLTRHVYVAALAIPFHDWRFREALRREGELSISTRRFPIAALLMFIDSIQDDRRDPASLRFEERDALQDLEVRGDTVEAIVDIGRVTPEVLPGKRVEAQGVTGFLTQDGVKFRYPAEFLPED
jgi:hypothetical protein